MKKFAWGALALTAIVWAGAGCDIFPDGGDESQNARLQPFSSEAELRDYLVGQNSKPSRPGILFNGAVDFDEAAGGDGGMPTAAPSADNSGGGMSTGDSRNYSGTTEQEAGVQEADVMKSDGTYFYVLSRNVLRIVKAAPADNMSVVSSVELDGWGIELYLAGDRVVALTAPEQPYYLSPPGIAVDAMIAPDFAPYRPQAEITVINVADRTNPAVLSRTRLDGTINTSRMIGDRVYLVIANYPDIFVQPLLDGVQKRSFSDVPLADILPDIAIEVAGAEVYRGNINAYDDHFRPEAEDGLGLTSLVTFDINQPQTYDAQTIVAYPANVYASTEALYLTDQSYDFSGDVRETTDIYKFILTQNGVAQAAAGTVPGRVLNQYSMSEHQGFLRVATTKGPIWGPTGQETQSSNHVYVLEQVNDELTVAGSIDNLAPGEAIFSARFIGDKGYLVTFEQIDPLFTLDLSDPRAPKAVGELKVPGFSTFIVPMGENHLLTVGQDTDEQFGFANGVRLSIFDVSDFANPVLAHHTVIGLDGSAYSDALYNPKAFTYFPEGDMVALPINFYAMREVGGGFVDFDFAGSGAPGSAGAAEESTPPSDAVSEPKPTNIEPNTGSDAPIDVVIDLPQPVEYESFSGLYVYHATAADGFSLLGRIAATTNEQDFYYYYPQFIRGAFIDDKVYCVTSENVQAAAVSDVSTVISTVAFPAPDDGGSDLPPPLPEPMPEPGPDPMPSPADGDGTVSAE